MTSSVLNAPFPSSALDPINVIAQAPQRRIGELVTMRNLTSDYKMVMCRDQISIGRVSYKVLWVEPQSNGRITVTAKIVHAR